MFWTVEKLEKRIKELASYRYREVLPLESFQALLDLDGEVSARQPEEGEWAEMKIGERWEGRDTYIWLKASVSFPEGWKGKKIVGVFDFGKTGSGHNSGFESLLYVNGTPYQGVDLNHQEVFFKSELAGETAELCFRLWSGLEGGGKRTLQEHRLNTAFLACLDEKADDLFFTSYAALETVKYLDEHQPERQQLLSAADRAFLKIDWSEPGSEEFYQSIYEAQSLLNNEIEKIPNHYPVTVTAIGHTHIDVAWLWRLKHTREKAARSFFTVLRLMEQYPDYTFLQTQPQLYDYMKQDYPEIYSQIKERAEEGRWETDGGMWLEADCNLTSGESLVRQLLYGTKFFREEFGKDCEYLWLPDVFGYSWALPQILIKSGIKTFMTTKISWNQFNRMPHDTFKWRGIDGTEILTHFITTPEDARWFYTYNGVITPRSVKGIWENYRDKGVNQELLLSYGYGDGGGGVNREMLEMRRRLDKMPGIPAVKTGRADSYFRRLHETVEKSDQYVHTWDGELYLEYHRGTYTSQGCNKRMNRKMELLLREAEWLNTVQSIRSGNWSSYPAEDLAESWKIVLRNQFHDIIPGSSIREVYEDSREEYEQAFSLASQAWKQAAASLLEMKEKDAVTLFNSSGWERSECVEIKDFGDRSLLFKDEQGKQLNMQKTYDGNWLLFAENVPALGAVSLTAHEGKLEETSSFQVNGRKLSTPYYEIVWNESGQFTSIYDKENNREVLAQGAAGNILQVFEDKPMQFDAWDIDLYYQQKMKIITRLTEEQVLENGKLRCVLGFSWKYGSSEIQQKIMFYANSRRIDFETKVDWHERDQLLKAAFPVDIRATEATYDIQYGNVKRPTHWNTSWDYARFETVAHQWADLSETGYGVSLLNDCKYGHDIKDNVMRLTLLKSAVYPDIEADQGEHIFTYSLFPHSGSWLEGSTVQEAWSLNNPLIPAAGEMAKQSLFTVEGSHLMIDSVKKGEFDDCLILRLHEYAGARGTVEIKSDHRILSIHECDLMEREDSENRSSNQNSFSIKPYEIKTFAVRLELE
ncbi:alpha-mannosidase [Metabacillus sp. GX 13764]|uniref:alpha-mannosidase n=1 Tax=Metabacillus kandeliae TaxID=2900151 RepID=UPI001E2FDEC8|nr:alpha-mannosidase [Metabacillus kandeliae]MCD7036398.1 alpha-mannosidase [Metabacillus kandeliae]